MNYLEDVWSSEVIAVHRSHLGDRGERHWETGRQACQ